MFTPDGTRYTFLMFILIGIGLVMLFSTSAIYAESAFNDSYFFFKRQLLYSAAGFILFLFFSFFNYKKLKGKGYLIYGLAVIALLVVFIPGIGHSAGGARRWIRLFSFTVQPAEFVKLAMIIFFADYFSKTSKDLFTFKKGFLLPLCLLGGCLCLVLAQPDFGTACAIGLFSIIIFYLSGVKVRYLLGTLLCSLPAVYLFVFHVAYRKKRILAFLNPWKDPHGIGFQIIQSFIALGSGGLFGVGLGQSKQKLYYLPEAHTDFIFSIIGEELGFVGALSILMLFCALFITGLRILSKAQDRFLFLTAGGIIAMVSFQVVINIAVVTGSVPTKGLPLPFISFGGSSLLVMMAASGIMVKIDEISAAARKRKLPSKHGRILKI